MACIECICGKVRIELATRKPRGLVECSCTECWQHLKWCEDQGGPKAPCMPQGYYFDNAFSGPEGTIQRGRELLLPTVLRHSLSGGTTRVIATCCHSTMFATSPGYNGVAIAVYPDACKLSNYDDTPLLIRMSMIDYDEGKRVGGPPPLPKYTPVAWRGAGGMSLPKSGAKIAYAMGAIFTKHSLHDFLELESEGYPVDKLLERLEETRDLQQPDLNKPLPSLRQQFQDDVFYVYPGPFTPSTSGCFPCKTVRSRSLPAFMKSHKAARELRFHKDGIAKESND